MTGDYKRQTEAAKKWVDFPNLNLPAEHSQGTMLIFPRIWSVSNRPASAADNASCVCACWRSVKNRSIYCCAAIYRGKYVHPGPARAWWFLQQRDIWYSVVCRRELIKATSITQLDNVCTQEKEMTLARQPQQSGSRLHPLHSRWSFSSLSWSLWPFLCCVSH